MTMAVNLTLSEERDNLFSNLRKLGRICFAQTDESDRAFKLLMEVWEKVSYKLWELGYRYDYGRCLNIALESAKAINDLAAQALRLRELGWSVMELGDLVTAEHYFNEALQKFELVNDALGQCNSLRSLGVLSFRQHRWDDALRYYHQAWDILVVARTEAPISSQSKWDWQEASLHNLFGCLYLELQNFSASSREFELALEKYRSMGNAYRHYQTVPLLNLGSWYVQQGSRDKARQCYKECYQLSQELHCTDTEVGALFRLAELAEAEGNYEEALKLACQAERVAGTEVPLERDRAAHLKERLVTEYFSDNI